MTTTPPFAITPDARDLAAASRDLRFHPSTVEDPGTLTRTQVDAFNRDGYLKGLRVFSDAEAAGIRDYFDDLLARTLAAGGDSYSISSAHLRYGRVYDLLAHPRIVAIVTDLIRRAARRLGLALFLQAARGWQGRGVAPGRELLAADAFEGRDRVARH